MFHERHKNRLITFAAMMTAFIAISYTVSPAQTAYLSSDCDNTELQQEIPSEPEASADELPFEAPSVSKALVAGIGNTSSADSPERDSSVNKPVTSPEDIVSAFRNQHFEEVAAEKAAAEAAEKAEAERAAAEAAEKAAAHSEPYLKYYEKGYYPAGENGILETADGQTISYSSVLYCSATAYTTERQENKITATGTVAHVGGIAVDPTVIPYGTRMYIVSAAGAWAYGYAVAEDCGGGIKGNRVDLFLDTYDECIEFGVRNCVIYILD